MFLVESYEIKEKYELSFLVSNISLEYCKLMQVEFRIIFTLRMNCCTVLG